MSDACMYIACIVITNLGFDTADSLVDPWSTGGVWFICVLIDKLSDHMRQPCTSWQSVAVQ